MIRVFVLVGLVGGLVIAYLTVFAVGPISQLPPSESLLTGFRTEGVVPATVNLEEDDAIEEADVFEVPEQDAVMLKQILAKGGSMPGMNMSGAGTTPMKMDGDNTAMAGSGNSMNGDGKAPMKMDGKAPMKMDGNKTPEMKSATGSTAMNGSTMDGSMAMNADAAKDMPMGDKMGEGGLLVTDDGKYDREINLTMAEWKFSNMKIDVKPGERIKFTVNNGGQIPHEFMFMSAPLMSAVAYRATRADWNLVEHKALFEKALVLPGGKFSFVLKVTQPGSWMFMCMLPYHMQMGMMGQMATPGMAMDMKM